MPALFRCERKRLTESQLLAVRNYIKRKKLKVGNSSTNGVANPTENGKQDCPSDSGTTTNIPVVPPGPSAQELREEKENSLRDVTKQLDELERTLDSLKQKKHELFEDIKSLLSSESKKQAEERDRQIHGFPQPFQAVGQGALLNMSPYRPGMLI